MRTYIFFYLDSRDSIPKLDYKEFIVSGSTFSVASSRFFNFLRNVNSQYISYCSSYKVISASGRATFRSFKELDLRYLSKICQSHTYCYSSSDNGDNND